MSADSPSVTAILNTVAPDDRVQYYMDYNMTFLHPGGFRDLKHFLGQRRAMYHTDDYKGPISIKALMVMNAGLTYYEEDLPTHKKEWKANGFRHDGEIYYYPKCPRGHPVELLHHHVFFGDAKKVKHFDQLLKYNDKSEPTENSLRWFEVIDEGLINEEDREKLFKAVSSATHGTPKDFVKAWTNLQEAGEKRPIVPMLTEASKLYKKLLETYESNGDFKAHESYSKLKTYVEKLPEEIKESDYDQLNQIDDFATALIKELAKSEGESNKYKALIEIYEESIKCFQRIFKEIAKVKKDPVRHAVDMHNMILQYMPFVRANRRVARLVMYYHLIKHHIFPPVFWSQSMYNAIVPDMPIKKILELKDEDLKEFKSKKDFFIMNVVDSINCGAFMAGGNITHEIACAPWQRYARVGELEKAVEAFLKETKRSTLPEILSALSQFFPSQGKAVISKRDSKEWYWSYTTQEVADAVTKVMEKENIKVQRVHRLEFLGYRCAAVPTKEDLVEDWVPVALLYTPNP